MADTRAFKGFSDEQMKRIGNIMGYTGPVSGFKDYLKSNPALEAKYSGLESKARMKFAEGGVTSMSQKYADAMSEANRLSAGVDPNATSRFALPLTPPEGVQGTTVTAEQIQASRETPTAMMDEGAREAFNQANQQRAQATLAPEYMQGQQIIPPDDGQVRGGPAILPVEPPPQQVPAQEVPVDSVRDLYEQHNKAQNDYYQQVDNDAPDYVKEAKRLRQEYATQLRDKYNQRGSDLQQKIEEKFRSRVSADMSAEERTALMQEVRSDPDYVALQQMQEEMRNDPLAQMMDDNDRIYSNYIRGEMEAWQMANPAPTVGDAMVRRAMTPGVPVGGQLDPQQVQQTEEQFIEKGTGEVDAGALQADTTQAQVTEAGDVERFDVSTVDTATSQAGVQQAVDQNKAVQGEVSQEAQVDAQTMDPLRTQVGSIPPAQIDKATQIQKPQSRTLQEGELVQSTFNAREAAAFAEEITAAQANPSARATVQGQLDTLMQGFDEGQTPTWAAGALRNAAAQMAARGLSSSSMAGQAMIQAAMESALPIAMTDAATYKEFEIENLSNRQARAILAAEQRANFIGREFDMEFQAQVMNASKISDIANMNFSAEQQIALENAKLAQTANLANLSNRQAMVMAEAAQISNIELTNLNNRQQAAVQNAQAFLQMDLTNLSNEQQTQMFNSQALVQSIMSDTAAENAARQFNAGSENQVNQFFSGMASTLSQFNATQNNTISQFNADQTNVIEKFNTEMQNLREQFNAQNQLIIEQSDVQWRRQIATLDTAAINTANQFNATAVLDISNTAYANLWQQYRDTMEWAWTSTENERDRDSAIARMQMQVDYSKWAAKEKESAESSAAWGDFVFDMVKDWL